MQVYVQSRGFAQEHDYHWIDEQGKPVEEHKLIKKYQHLIQSDSYSVMLVRDESQLILLVTGIKSSRKDFRDRTIRISVAWIGDSSEDNEKRFRQIAVSFLQEIINSDKNLSHSPGNLTHSHNKLIQSINDLIIEEQNYDFKVEDFKQLHQLTIQDQEIRYEQLPESLEASKKPQLYKPERNDKIVNELKNYCLPKNDGALVVVTGLKPLSALEDKVWRGLTTLDYLDDKKYVRKNYTNTEESENILNRWLDIIQRNINRRSIVTVSLVISLIFNVFLGYQLTIKNEIKQIEQQIQEVEYSKQKLPNQLELLENQKQEIIKKIEFISNEVKKKEIDLQKQKNRKSELENQLLLKVKPQAISNKI